MSMLDFCPKDNTDRWLWASTAIALIPVVYCFFNHSVTYMSINFCYAVVIFGVLVYQLIMSVVHKKKISITKNPTIWFFLCFVFWIFVSAVFSISPAASWLGIMQKNHSTESVFQFFAYALFAVCAYRVKKENKDWLLSLIVWLSCFYIFMGFINPNQTFIGFTTNSYRYSLMFFNPNHSGYIMCMTGVVAACKVLTCGKWWKRVCFSLAFVFHAAFLCLNGSLGPIFGLFFGLVAVVIYYLVKRKKIAVFACLFIVGFVLVATTVDFMPIVSKARADKTPLYAKIGGVIGFISKSPYEYNGEEVAGSDGWNRFSMWRACLKNVTKRPLTGTGVGTFSVSNPEFGVTNPHNEYLQFLSIAGIPALMFYLAGIAGIVVQAIKKKNLSGAGVCGVAGLVAYFVSAFFGNTIPGVLPVFALVLGIVLCEIKKEI